MSSRFFGGIVHCPDVIAVDPRGGDAVGWSSGSNPVSRELLLHRRADRESVVSAKEDRSCLQHRREVKRWVKVALARRSFAEIAHHHSGSIDQSERHACPGAWGSLVPRGEEMVWNLSALEP